MHTFRIVPKIVELKTAAEFCTEFEVNEDDLVFISKSTESCFEGRLEKAHVIYRGDYGSGEPTDSMVEAIYNDIKDIDYKRVIAVGGGTIIDVAKLLALKTFSPVTDLFSKKFPAQKEKELIVIPTTCGTGSEVTNISILELTQLNTKMGLADDALFPDYAVLIPQLLENLPDKFFAASSIDALIHSTESYLSPKATTMSKAFSESAIKKILSGYMDIYRKGKSARKALTQQFLAGSTEAGIAFGNAGCGYVHAMSYPFGANYHVPHGEANYVLFLEIFKEYQKANPEGNIKSLNALLAKIMGCPENSVYEELEKVLDCILPHKKMSAYGAKLSDIDLFTTVTVKKQVRLTSNGYIQFTPEKIKQIYSAVL
ncbi:MAG: 4-hydroxybutyrate dehydrogenase [Treponema sp.]|nr:4-hydroxybutyrate dehydrogenase [Spirochaetia bacterium]MDD7013764.1 4-hydroxybutyrate dehydrogenase [Spirochaetales bacterium]MDY4902874.1 4-hydroxybutyrate dehydrogenase [Treponema sp.]